MSKKRPKAKTRPIWPDLKAKLQIQSVMSILGKMSRGSKKNVTPEDRERRRQAMRAINERRRKKSNL